MIPTGVLQVTSIFRWGEAVLSLLRRSFVLPWPGTSPGAAHPKTFGSMSLRPGWAKVIFLTPPPPLSRPLRRLQQAGTGPEHRQLGPNPGLKTQGNDHGPSFGAGWAKVIFPTPPLSGSKKDPSRQALSLALPLSLSLHVSRRCWHRPCKGPRSFAVCSGTLRGETIEHHSVHFITHQSFAFY